MRIRLIMLGKTHRGECRALLEDYVQRLRRYATVDVLELRDGSTLPSAALKRNAARLVLLDAGGKMFSSQEFARWIAAHRDRGTRELVFLCGAADGFSEPWLRQAHEKISLSSFTLPHELARVVLAEQLYRAFTILSGHPYSK